MMVRQAMTLLLAAALLGCASSDLGGDSAPGAAIDQAETVVPSPTSGDRGAADLLDQSDPGDDRVPVLSTPASDRVVEFTPESKEPFCPGVDSALSALLSSEDPLTHAGLNGLHLTEDGVSVNIKLVSADSKMAEDPGTIRNIFGPNIEAYVPLNRLCEVAADPAVLNVSPILRLGSP